VQVLVHDMGGQLEIFLFGDVCEAIINFSLVVAINVDAVLVPIDSCRANIDDNVLVRLETMARLN